MEELESPSDEPLSASLGAAADRSGEGVGEPVRRADRLRYKSRQSGRARVESEAD